MRLPLALALASVLLLAGSAGASSPGSQAGATASAYGVKIVPGATSTSVSAPPNAVGFTSGFAYPSDGSVLTTGPISVSANTDVGANARSIASSSVSSLSLFGGEVTASNITGHANASTSGQSATGSLAGAAVSGLTVGGVAQTASPNGRVALGDWGYAITLEQAEVRSPAGKTQSYRGYGRRLPRPRARELAPRRRHLRAPRNTGARLCRRDDLLGRLEQRRRQPPLATRRPGERVLLRASLGVLAGREERQPRQSGRGGRLRRQHG